MLFSKLAPAAIISFLTIGSAVAAITPAFNLRVSSSFADIDGLYIQAKARKLPGQGAKLVPFSGATPFTLNTASGKLATTVDSSPELGIQNAMVTQERLFFGNQTTIDDLNSGNLRPTVVYVTCQIETSNIGDVSERNLVCQAEDRANLYGCLHRFGPNSSGLFLGGEPLKGKSKCGDVMLVVEDVAVAP